MRESAIQMGESADLRIPPEHWKMLTSDYALSTQSEAPIFSDLISLVRKNMRRFRAPRLNLLKCAVATDRAGAFEKAFETGSCVCQKFNRFARFPIK